MLSLINEGVTLQLNDNLEVTRKTQKSVQSHFGMAGAAPLPDVEDVLQRYGQSAEILGEYDIPDESDQVEVVDNGRVRVTKTTRVLVRVIPPELAEQDVEGQAETLNASKAKPPLSPDDQKKEFYLQMEKERKKIIAVQRRSTPDDVASNYLNAINAALSGQLDSDDLDDVHPGEVDSQSILDNKHNTKKFLINKMLESSEDNDDPRAESRQTAVKAEVALTSSNKISSPPKMATTVTKNGFHDIEHVPASVHDIPAVNGKQEQMHLVEARLCFIDQAAALPSFNGVKRDKSTSTIITENKIAREIEECRLREEELKLQRFERLGRSKSQEDILAENVFKVEVQIIPEVVSGGLVESMPVYVEESRHSSPMPSLYSEVNTPEMSKAPSVDEDFASSRIKVRPLQDDSDDDDKPMYVVLKESAVEREIRLARGREEELRREISQREVNLKGRQQEEDSAVILKDASLLKDSKQVPALLLEGAVTESSSADTSSPKPEEQSWLEVPALTSPVLEATLKSAVVEVPLQNGHVSLIQKRSGVSLSLSTTKSKPSSRVTEQNMASARLQEEVNEVILKELALKESGSIATTSQDRIDEKVINIRQYKVERSPSAIVPQSAPPLQNTPPTFKLDGTMTSNGSPYAPMARQVSYAGQPSAAPRPNLYRSATQRGMMARFINSKGRMSAMPVFVPKVTKPAPLEVITDQTPQTPPLELTESGPRTQEMNTKDDTSSVNSSEQELAKSKPEIMTYRRNYSMVENKILSELRDMKEREEELKKQRIASFRRNSKGSLESLLESEDSGENNGHSDSPTGFDGIFSFAKDYDSDNSLENQTFLQSNTRKSNYWINQWEERLHQK